MSIIRRLQPFQEIEDVGFVQVDAHAGIAVFIRVFRDGIQVFVKADSSAERCGEVDLPCCLMLLFKDVAPDGLPVPAGCGVIRKPDSRPTDVCLVLIKDELGGETAGPYILRNRTMGRYV